ncbi:MAG: ABC transporter permease [Chitinophagaceae bacterium]|nr:MAG: ABC transporter permease [Chitinophagaceae bacterium]
MNKTWLIIQREYTSRVKNKRFLLITILMPLLMVAFIVGSAYLSSTGTEQRKIAVIDPNGFFKGHLKNSQQLEFNFPSDVDTSNYKQKGYTDVLILPKFEGNQKVDYILRSKKSMGMMLQESITNKINSAIEDQMLQEAGIHQDVLDSIHKSSQFAELKAYEDKGKTSKESNAALASGIGYASGFLIYLTMFIYGSMVMRGVMEEKTNRIAEVIISSVKPFELMMGKIIGIGAVGLTQFLLWIVLITTLSSVALGMLPADIQHQVSTLQQSNGQMAGGMMQASESAQRIYNIQHTLATANWPLIISCFIFYFLGGFLFYASLFAAVGSVVNEDPQDAQSLMFPITMPIIFSYVITNVVIQNPNTPMAFWASIIPFSSPMVMMARIAYGVPSTVPYWELALSMLTLIAGFVFTTWLSGKIYRTGILMYGKKATWKEMLKWAFKKA